MVVVGAVLGGLALAIVGVVAAWLWKFRYWIEPVIFQGLPEQTVEGRRLGRHVHHDPRSRRYTYDTRGLTLVSAKHPFHVPTLDQGQLGSCTGNALTGCLSTLPFVDKLPADVKLNEAEAVSLYSAATRLDKVPGSYPPDDTGSSGIAVCKAAQAAGLIGGYRHTFTLDDALLALGRTAVIIGISWHTGMDTPSPNGRIRPTGAVRGGHEVCLDEIDVANRRVWIHNSWGDGWGVRGRAWLSFADLGTLLADQGDCTIPTPAGVTPKPQPASRSWWGWLVDLWRRLSGGL